MFEQVKAEQRVRRAGAAGLLALGLVLLASCSDDDRIGPGYGAYSACRFDPLSCPGNPGGACRVDADCSTGQCCTERANCGGGMCVLACRGDADCPADMACEHAMCFFRCRGDGDCAVGQRCEHGHRVCEWP
jgi:hypothetical protein